LKSEKHGGMSKYIHTHYLHMQTVKSTAVLPCDCSALDCIMLRTVRVLLARLHIEQAIRDQPHMHKRCGITDHYKGNIVCILIFHSHLLVCVAA
jgi:hypothetical protein